MSDIDEATRAALLLADDSTDEAAQARLRRRKRFIIGRRIAFLAIAFIIGAGIAVYFAGQLPRPPRNGVPAWQRTLGYCLMVGGFVLEIIYFVVVVRNGEFRAGWRSPSLVLGWRQRRAIRQQIRGNRAVDPAVLPISRELATRTKRLTTLTLMLLAFPMIFGGQALASGSPTRLQFAIAFTALYLCFIPYIFWESRRAARFLERHPAPAPVPEE